MRDVPKIKNPCADCPIDFQIDANTEEELEKLINGFDCEAFHRRKMKFVFLFR